MSSRGAFSYLRRVVERSSGLEFAAKFIPSQAKPKASARREARLLARLQHDCVLYFHEAFERRRGLVIVTELYPGTRRGKSVLCKGKPGDVLPFAKWSFELGLSLGWDLSMLRALGSVDSTA